MSRRYALERDLDELERMTERLQEYILGDQLYLSIGAGFIRGGSMPQMTLGALLLRRRRLTSLRARLDSEQAARLEAALARHNSSQREWTLHYEKKLRGEAPARLKLMRAFFLDCKQNPRDCGGAYPVEALRRTIVQEILLAMAEFKYGTEELRAAAQINDRALRPLLDAGDFIWSPVLEKAYPRATFWWLYGRPGH